MLDCSPTSLMSEVTSAEKFRDNFLNCIRPILRTLAGNWFRKDQPAPNGTPLPDNLSFAYWAETLPSIVFDNPQVTCSAKRVITHEPVAQWMRYAINGWIKDVDLRDELEKVATDMLVGFGVMKVGLETRGNYTADQSRGVEDNFRMKALTPFAVRVAPENFILDSQCKTFGQHRIIGSRFQRDLEDLQSDARYDQSVVAKLSGEGKDNDDRENQPAFKGPKNSEDRKRVTLYDLYLPEYRAICTIAKNANGAGQFLRKLTEYKGPPSGPYVMFGVYAVPGQPYPLSPLMAMHEGVMEYNIHRAAAASDAKTTKNLTIVDGNSPNLADQVRNADSGDVLAIDTFDKSKALTLTLGGVSPAQLEYTQFVRDGFDRTSGTSDAQRGRASGVTATEASIVNANTDARSEFLHLKFAGSVKDVLTNVGWYMFYEPSVVMPVSWSDPQSGQQQEGQFLGGVQPGQEDMDWTGFNIDIEPYSLRRIDPQQQQQQANMVMQIAMQVAPAMLQFPFVNWRAILDMIGEANNLPDLANTLLTPQGMQMIQAMTMPGMLAGVQPGMGGMLPRGANQQLAAGMQGAPVNGMQQASMPMSGLGLSSMQGLPMRPAAAPGLPPPQAPPGLFGPAPIQIPRPGMMPQPGMRR